MTINLILRNNNEALELEVLAATDELTAIKRNQLVINLFAFGNTLGPTERRNQAEETK